MHVQEINNNSVTLPPESLTQYEIWEMQKFQDLMEYIIGSGGGSGISKSEEQIIQTLANGSPQDQQVAKFLSSLSNTPQGDSELQTAIYSGVVPPS